MTTLAQIKARVHADQISRQKDGSIVFRSGYFYRHGRTAEKFRDSIQLQLSAARISHKLVDYGDHYASFNGSASLARSSHFYVRIELNPEGE